MSRNYEGDLIKMEHTKNCFQLLLEGVVEKAWIAEERFHETIFNKDLKRTENICQGMCRQVVSMLGEVFDAVMTISIRVQNKTHLIVVVEHAGYKFIVDGTIRQFKPGLSRLVWDFEEYPFQKELEKAETWTIVEIKK